MEDASKVISNFQDAPGNGYFAVFDGHAGSMSAKWCANNIYKLLARNLALFSQNCPVSSILALTFDQADSCLCGLPEYDNSGCTAALVYVKAETNNNIGQNLPPTTAQLLPTPSPYMQSPRKRRFSSFSPASPQFMIPSPNTSNKDGLNLDFPQPGISKRTLYTANVGDSRIVLSRNGTAYRLTSDHRASDNNEIDRIKTQGGSVSSGRVDGSLAVSRALGDKSFKPYVCARPYTSEFVLDEHDEFVVLACDGVWDVCSDQSIINLIRDIENPAEASQEVVRHALLKGSTDNITCMVVRLKKAADCYDMAQASSTSSLFSNTTPTTPISIPHSISTSPKPFKPNFSSDIPPRVITTLDTAYISNLPISLPTVTERSKLVEPKSSLLRPSLLETSSKRRSQFDALLFSASPISPAESDLTISEEDDEDSLIGGVEIDDVVVDDGDRDADDDELIYEGIMGAPEVVEPKSVKVSSSNGSPSNYKINSSTSADIKNTNNNTNTNKHNKHNSSIIQRPKEFLHHMRATSFSPSSTISRQKQRQQRYLYNDTSDMMDAVEFEQNTEESSLDRYGRFKRIVSLEYDYDGDECAIAEDSD